MDAAEWDARYAEAAGAGGRVWSAEPNALVAEVLHGIAPGSAVDLGAGEGRHAVWLADQGWRVTAVDFSDVGMAAGRAEAEARGLDIAWIVADATAWAPPARVDLVLLAYLHLPSAAFSPLLRRSRQWLRPGGRLVVVAHSLENLTAGVGGPQDPDLLPTAESLRAAVGDELEVDRCEQVERPTLAGTALDLVLVAHAPA
jgi:SAM-dependent methyltransferase